MSDFVQLGTGIIVNLDHVVSVDRQSTEGRCDGSLRVALVSGTLYLDADSDDEKAFLVALRRRISIRPAEVSGASAPTSLAGDIVFDFEGAPDSLSGDLLVDFLCDAIDAVFGPDTSTRGSNGPAIDALYRFLDVAVTTPEQHEKLRAYLDGYGSDAEEA